VSFVRFSCAAHVLAFDINKDQEMENLGVQYEAMETILNLLTLLHCPLNDNTKHMINKSSL
jgi:D-lactate dehydrogenase